MVQREGNIPPSLVIVLQICVLKELTQRLMAIYRRIAPEGCKIEILSGNEVLAMINRVRQRKRATSNVVVVITHTGSPRPANRDNNRGAGRPDQSFQRQSLAAAPP